MSLSRRLFAAAAALFPFAITRSASAAAKPDRKKLIGTWKMVGNVARGPDGKVLDTPFGPKGMGLLTMNADGRMMAVLCDGRTEIPAGETRDYSSYCGNWTFDGEMLVTHVDASGIPRIKVGGDQPRKVRFDGPRLVLIPPPITVNGVEQHREVFWERISTHPA